MPNYMDWMNGLYGRPTTPIASAGLPPAAHQAINNVQAYVGNQPAAPAAPMMPPAQPMGGGGGGAPWLQQPLTGGWAGRQQAQFDAMGRQLADQYRGYAGGGAGVGSM